MKRTPSSAPSPLLSLLYNALARSAWLGAPGQPRGRAGALWRRIWRKSVLSFSAPVRTRIHGRAVIANYGHSYPFYTRWFPGINQPIVELVYQASQVLGRPVSLVDVGANIGDTILLLDDACPGMVGEYACVEGEAEFFAYLRSNLGHRAGGHFFRAMLSDRTAEMAGLVRAHAGTASAYGDGLVEAVMLDALLDPPPFAPVDLLKIDVDGYDGKVLLGARGLLRTQRPAVVFEWHPLFCRRVGAAWSDHFDALAECGYTTLVWFTKYGAWSHFSSPADHEAIGQLAELCLTSAAYPDWHYDVVALHERSPVAPGALAELAYARRRRWRV